MCQISPELIVAWHKFLWCQHLFTFLDEAGKYFPAASTMMLSSFRPPPSSRNEAEENFMWVVYDVRVRSEPLNVVSLPGTRWFYRGKKKNHWGTTKTKHQSITACLTCTSLFPFLSFHSFFPPYHFTTPSLPSHTPPSVSLSLYLSFFFLSRAVGLLFMASPVEDALLYKTLEPSTRPTPFEDVAHNSYLGL